MRLTLTLTAIAILTLVWWTRIRRCSALADDYGAWRDLYTDHLAQRGHAWKSDR